MNWSLWCSKENSFIRMSSTSIFIWNIFNYLGSWSELPMCLNRTPMSMNKMGLISSRKSYWLTPFGSICTSSFMITRFLTPLSRRLAGELSISASSPRQKALTWPPLRPICINLLLASHCRTLGKEGWSDLRPLLRLKSWRQLTRLLSQGFLQF